ncbi:YggS family pyridoxal phosphate-dependent enzyme [Desulfovibrio sp. OttesenSCG-928-C14]|nr:YggS family pyridoxal phosphate-dependent enzyme [Desulfovibrio sp. OttesenSCG-928-C14]
MADSLLHQRLVKVLERLDQAARSCGRDPGEITLVAVSKLHGPERVADLARFWAGLIAGGRVAGPVIFAENYLQEALEKREAVAALLAAQGPDPAGAAQGPQVAAIQAPEWHFTGHLQSRKAKGFAGAFALLHTLDSLSLARNLQKEFEKNLASGSPARPQPVLLQVNIGREEQKSGLNPEELVSFISELKEFTGLEIKGLMCLPPYFAEGEKSRPYFRELRQLRDRARRESGLDLPELSMGMSHDFEVAIEEGATLVRVGTDIFGERK